VSARVIVPIARTTFATTAALGNLRFLYARLQVCHCVQECRALLLHALELASPSTLSRRFIVKRCGMMRRDTVLELVSLWHCCRSSRTPLRG
jgi:hypothetical protein